MRPSVLLCLSVLGLTSLAAQENPDVYRNTEYVGGHSALLKNVNGALILTDSGITFHKCIEYCAATKKHSGYDSIPLLFVKYSEIKEASATNNVRGASVGSKILFGGFASDRNQEFVGVIYETTSRAEAPIFKTQKSKSMAIEAQIKFLAKKAGSPIAEIPRSGGD